MLLRRILSRAPPPQTEPVMRRHRLPHGERIYAIGDIHGRLDCLNALLDMIVADDKRRGAAHTSLVFLGDLVDRGPDSRGVVERALQLASVVPCMMLTGNHEEILIRAWDGDAGAAALFDRVGGRETLISYGVEEDIYEAANAQERATLAHTHIPARHIDFLRGFHDWYARGSYLFVHAGIRPGVPIEEQKASDLRWIRQNFLQDQRDHGVMVVHGHSITNEIDEKPNRIGLDTGAYATDRLTAIGLEGTERWFLTTGEDGHFAV